MGDEADYALERIYDTWDDDDDEGFDYYEKYNDFDSFLSEKLSYPRCKYCGMVGLKWFMTEKGWRLFHSNGTIHRCNSFDILRHSGLGKH